MRDEAQWGRLRFGVLRNLPSLLDTPPFIVMEDRKAKNGTTENGQNSSEVHFVDTFNSHSDSNSNRSMCFHVSLSVPCL